MPQALPLQERLSQNSSKSATYRVLKSELGNGYRQFAADGINVKRDKWTLMWENVDETERDTIIAAFDSVGGWDYFTWVPFGESVSKKFMITEEGYKYSALSGNLYTVEVVVEQEYR